MRFKYLNKLKVVGDHFFTGQVVTALNYRAPEDTHNGVAHYVVRFEDGNIENIPEGNLASSEFEEILESN